MSTTTNDSGTGPLVPNVPVKRSCLLPWKVMEAKAPAPAQGEQSLRLVDTILIFQSRKGRKNFQDSLNPLTSEGNVRN